jgi:protein TonB
MEKHTKLISGILAVSIYLLFVGVLIAYFNHHKRIKRIHFVAKNDKQIVISLASLPEQTRSPHRDKKRKIKTQRAKKAAPRAKKKKIPSKSSPHKKTVAKKRERKVVEERSKSKSKVDLNKLFKKVKERKPEVKKKKPPKKKSEQKRKGKEQDKGIEQAYFAKVERMLQNWPAQSDFAGEKIKVWLKIQPDGSFTFKIRSASGNAAFNDALIAYLKQLQSIGFGSHSRNRPYELDVEFVAKE